MIRPATPEDLFSIVVRGNESSVWLSVLSAPNLSEVIAENRMIVGLVDGAPYFCVGVGRLPFAGVVVPWVWAAFDVMLKSHLRYYIRHHHPQVVAYLDKNAPLAYTAPEGPQPVYSRFLEWFGFRHLGWGLWQWPPPALKTDPR